jgi:hypothetical protein
MPTDSDDDPPDRDQGRPDVDEVPSRSELSPGATLDDDEVAEPNDPA